MILNLVVQIEHVSNLATSLGSHRHSPVGRTGRSTTPTLQSQNRLAEAEVQRLVKARSDGLTISELAAEFEIHRTTVMAHLKRAKWLAT